MQNELHNLIKVTITNLPFDGIKPSVSFVGVFDLENSSKLDIRALNQNLSSDPFQREGD